MSNALFNETRNAIGGAGAHTLADLAAGNIKFHLIDTADHTVSLSADLDEADITDAAIVATSAILTATFGVVGVGVFDHADVTLAAVSGDTAEELVYFEDTGVDTTSPLICRFDTFASGMPVTPNGGDIDIQPSASGLFVL